MSCIHNYCIVELQLWNREVNTVLPDSAHTLWLSYQSTHKLVLFLFYFQGRVGKAWTQGGPTRTNENMTYQSLLLHFM